MTGVGDQSVATDTAFVLHRYGYYEGARLASADGSAEYRINEVRSEQAALIDAEAHPGATADILGDEFEDGSWFSVFDYGVGDSVEWPYTVTVTEVSDGVYSVDAPCPVTVRLPEAGE